MKRQKRKWPRNYICRTSSCRIFLLVFTRWRRSFFFRNNSDTNQFVIQSRNRARASSCGLFWTDEWWCFIPSWNCYHAPKSSHWFRIVMQSKADEKEWKKNKQFEINENPVRQPVRLCLVAQTHPFRRRHFLEASPCVSVFFLSYFFFVLLLFNRLQSAWIIISTNVDFILGEDFFTLLSPP